MPFIDSQNCRLSYTVTGPDGGIPVVLIQGVGVAGTGWLPQTEFLSQYECRCVTFDNRGMGMSQPERPTKPRYGAEISVEQMAADTLAVMDAAGVRQAHVVGHSLGGLVAIHLGLTARERVRSLTLMCTFANGATGLKMTPRMFWLGMRSRIGPRSWRRNAFLKIVVSRHYIKRKGDRAVMAQRLAAYFGHDLADHPPVTSDHLRALKAYDATPRLGELAGMPTLIMSALEDPIARPADGGRVLNQKIPGARYYEQRNAAHGLPLQWAELVNKLLLEHVRAAK